MYLIYIFHKTAKMLFYYLTLFFVILKSRDWDATNSGIRDLLKRPGFRNLGTAVSTNNITSDSWASCSVILLRKKTFCFILQWWKIRKQTHMTLTV